MYTIKNYTRPRDTQALYSLLYEIKEELRLNNMETVREVVDRSFEKGGVIAAYDKALLCGMMGYFWGEPDHDFTNTDVVFMYVAGILPNYRRRRLFPYALKVALEQFKQAGGREIRLQAEKGNTYTNRLYARFAKPLGEGLSLNGVEAVTYGGTIDEALHSLVRSQRPSPHHPHPPVPPQNGHMYPLMDS